MDTLTDKDGMQLDIVWPRGKGPKGRKAKIVITAPDGSKSKFKLGTGFSGRIRQELERWIRASGRGKTFKG